MPGATAGARRHELLEPPWDRSCEGSVYQEEPEVEATQLPSLAEESFTTPMPSRFIKALGPRLLGRCGEAGANLYFADGNYPQRKVHLVRFGCLGCESDCEKYITASSSVQMVSWNGSDRVNGRQNRLKSNGFGHRGESEIRCAALKSIGAKPVDLGKLRDGHRLPVRHVGPDRNMRFLEAFPQEVRSPPRWRPERLCVMPHIMLPVLLERAVLRRAEGDGLVVAAAHRPFALRLPGDGPLRRRLAEEGQGPGAEGEARPGLGAAAAHRERIAAARTVSFALSIF